MRSRNMRRRKRVLQSLRVLNQRAHSRVRNWLYRITISDCCWPPDPTQIVHGRNLPRRSRFNSDSFTNIVTKRVFTVQLAESQANLGLLLDQLGDSHGAEQALRAAVKVLRPLADSKLSQPAPRATWRSLATT